jgi:glycerophosphoryl diester phosphodiesterase
MRELVAGKMGVGGVPRNTMLVLSHRGDHASGFQNTLQAFERARASGANGLETDVRTCAEGTAVLFHDRNTRNGTPITSLAFADLAESVGYEVPALAEALRSFPGLFWNLELKSTAALGPTLAVLDEVRPEGGVLITSFLHQVIFECAQRSSFDCGLLIAHRPVTLTEVFSAGFHHPNVNTLVVDYEVVDAQLFEEARVKQLSTFVYGMVTVEEHEFVAKHKVAGMITDHIQTARLALKH